MTDSVKPITAEEREKQPWYDLEGALDDMTRTGKADAVCLRTVKRACDNLFRYEARVAELEARAAALLAAVDAYGVECWDTDSFPAEVQAIIDASEATRKALGGGDG